MQAVSAPSSPPFAGEMLEDTEGINRIYSGGTDESPFGSTLATPTDQGGDLVQGIQSRLDLSENDAGYFVSKELATDEHALTDLLPESGAVIKASEAVDVDAVDQLAMHDNQSPVDTEMSMSFSTNFEPDSSIMSPVFSSPERDTASFSHYKSMYNLPNDHISIERADTPALQAETPQKREASPCRGPEEDDDNVLAPLLKAKEAAKPPWISGANESLFRAEHLSNIMWLPLRIFFFLPWLVAVGGALVLFPDRLEQITFGYGYLDSLSGIRRFSHWAEYGLYHFMVFASCLCLVLWFYPTGGWLLLGGLMAQFRHVWQDFSPDHNVPLGEDDRQSIYLLATSVWLQDSVLDIKQVEGQYYVNDRKKEARTAANEDGDSDADLDQTLDIGF